MRKVKFNTSRGETKGDLIKENHYTIWVKLDDGNVIKRHKRKHIVTDL